ncbi:hypothetical protein MKZ38_008991 [Zalerion maritima]|uniref:Uncharacterized protein n=1 Tax=Zalerion maritima TaxID=339359 RepID=A0AAD5RGK9_9PEZI|nr:hypothetical protein MKZ38_008991 [Zalerion maritima]
MNPNSKYSAPIYQINIQPSEYRMLTSNLVYLASQVNAAAAAQAEEGQRREALITRTSRVVVETSKLIEQQEAALEDLRTWAKKVLVAIRGLEVALDQVADPSSLPAPAFSDAEFVTRFSQAENKLAERRAELAKKLRPTSTTPTYRNVEKIAAQGGYRRDKIGLLRPVPPPTGFPIPSSRPLPPPIEVVQREIELLDQEDLAEVALRPVASADSIVGDGSTDVTSFYTLPALGQESSLNQRLSLLLEKATPAIARIDDNVFAAAREILLPPLTKANYLCKSTWIILRDLRLGHLNHLFFDRANNSGDAPPNTPYSQITNPSRETKQREKEWEWRWDAVDNYDEDDSVMEEYPDLQVEDGIEDWRNSDVAWFWRLRRESLRLIQTKNQVDGIFKDVVGMTKIYDSDDEDDSMGSDDEE